MSKKDGTTIKDLMPHYSPEEVSKRKRQLSKVIKYIDDQPEPQWTDEEEVKRYMLLQEIKQLIHESKRSSVSPEFIDQLLKNPLLQNLEEPSNP